MSLPPLYFLRLTTTAGVRVSVCLNNILHLTYVQSDETEVVFIGNHKLTAKISLDEIIEIIKAEGRRQHDDQRS